MSPIAERVRSIVSEYLAHYVNARQELEFERGREHHPQTLEMRRSTIDKYRTAHTADDLEWRFVKGEVRHHVLRCIDEIAEGRWQPS